MATTNGINYNQTRGLILSTSGKTRVIVSTGGTTTFTGDTSGSTVVSVSGTSGGLFSVIDTTTGTLLEVLDSSNNPIFQVGTTDKIKISGLTSATDPNVLTIDSSGIVHTIPTSSLGGGGGITWNNATTTQAMAVDNGYITTASTLTTFTLPSAIAFGKTVEIGGFSSGLWRLNQNSGQQIRFGITGTTTTSGILSATSQGDSIRIVCTVSGTSFMVVSSIGNIYYS